jgi:hypothetical protein
MHKRLLRVGALAEWMPGHVVLCQPAALHESTPLNLSRVARKNTVNRPAVFGRLLFLLFVRLASSCEVPLWK